MDMHAERLPASMLHEPTHALSERAAACPRRPSRPPRHARPARPTIGEDRVHLEQRAEVELQELGRQNSSTSSDSIGIDAGVLRQDDGAQDAAPRSQLTSVKVSMASVSCTLLSQGRPSPCSVMIKLRGGINHWIAANFEAEPSDCQTSRRNPCIFVYVKFEAGVVYLRVSLRCISSK